MLVLMLKFVSKYLAKHGHDFFGTKCLEEVLYSGTEHLVYVLSVTDRVPLLTLKAKQFCYYQVI